MINFDEEEAIIEREFEERSEHSDSEGYDSFLASGDDDDEYDLSSSSSSGSSSSSNAYSTSDANDDTDARGSFWENSLFTPVSALRRRGSVATEPDYHDMSGDDDNSGDEDSKTRGRPHRSNRAHRDRCPGRTPVNAMLGLSFLFWLFMYLTSSAGDEMDLRRISNVEFLKNKLYQKRYGKLTPGELAQLRKKQAQEARRAQESTSGGILVNAGEGVLNMLGGKAKKKKNREDLAPGCEYAAWQKLSYPNCNELHEIDLHDSLQLRTQQTLNGGSLGYVGSGLWRQVWKVDPHGEVGSVISETGAPMVLKLMKGEHYGGSDTHRNLERHRRDALVMERLTSSPHIVSMYGFCGNTVLTEYAGSDLETVIFKSDDVETKHANRKTPEGRLSLALDVARGVERLHNIDGGPIIHADITTTQYLVGLDGRIKLNDFNRCRWIAHKNTTGQTCDVKIPSAPGINRSPEEYEYISIDEKADMYSVANVLFSILTGEEPWLALKSSKVKSLIKAGQKPAIPKEFLLTANSTDSRLAALIDLAYEHDPEDRISSSELVDELESLMRQLRSIR